MQRSLVFFKDYFLLTEPPWQLCALCYGDAVSARLSNKKQLIHLNLLYELDNPVSPQTNT